MKLFSHVMRFIVAAIVLLFVSWIVPRFSVGGFWSALFLALVIAVLGLAVESLFGRKVSPFGKGAVGFLTSAIIIWISQFFVSDVSVTLFGALLAALVIGIIDLFLPVSTPFNAVKRGSSR